jgi:hypothetical protein
LGHNPQRGHLKGDIGIRRLDVRRIPLIELKGQSACHLPRFLPD